MKKNEPPCASSGPRAGNSPAPPRLPPSVPHSVFSPGSEKAAASLKGLRFSAVGTRRHPVTGAIDKGWETL
jgi:hypothetical protein